MADHQCSGCSGALKGRMFAVCDACVTKLRVEDVDKLPVRRAMEVHFSLNPLEAGMMLGLVAQQIHMPGEHDRADDAFRKQALKNIWTKLTNDLRDWQEAECSTQ